MSEARASSKDFADPVKSRAEKEVELQLLAVRQHSRSLSPGEMVYLLRSVQQSRPGLFESSLNSRALAALAKNPTSLFETYH